MKEKKIALSWYQHDDVVAMARRLLGKVLCTQIDGLLTKGIIVETEAYSGDNDKACHANNQKQTRRNKVMFGAGGHAYVYLCYGIHHLFNIVTNEEGRADAVLIRALQPMVGEDVMLQRRGLNKSKRILLTSGPGKLSQAMGINLSHYGISLDQDEIWLEDMGDMPIGKIIASRRIGVDYAGEDALKPWRFYMKENPWVS